LRGGSRKIERHMCRSRDPSGQSLERVSENRKRRRRGRWRGGQVFIGSVEKKPWGSATRAFPDRAATKPRRLCTIYNQGILINEINMAY
jgi:hypothetical protein